MLETHKYGILLTRSAPKTQRPKLAVVIVARPDERHLPFVVWNESVGADGELIYFTGSYCATLTEACAEFKSRTGVEA